MNTLKSLFIYCCFMTFVSLSYAQTAQSSEELLKQAQSDFTSGNYNKTIKSYLTLIDEGYSSEDLHFNLATAYYKAGNLPHAVLYYEKVLKADLYHKDAKINLKIVNDERASELSSIPDFFIKVWWKNLSGFLGSGLWSLLGLGAVLVSVYFFYVWLFKKPIIRNLISSLLMLGLGILFLMAAGTSNKLETDVSHLINLKPVTIYPSPDDKAKALSELIPGEKLRILDSVGDWYQVMLINKEQGWVMRNGLEEI